MSFSSCCFLYFVEYPSDPVPVLSNCRALICKLNISFSRLAFSLLKPSTSHSFFFRSSFNTDPSASSLVFWLFKAVIWSSSSILSFRIFFSSYSSRLVSSCTSPIAASNSVFLLLRTAISLSISTRIPFSSEISYSSMSIVSLWMDFVETSVLSIANCFFKVVSSARIASLSWLKTVNCCSLLATTVFSSLPRWLLNCICLLPSLVSAVCPFSAFSIIFEKLCLSFLKVLTSLSSVARSSFKLSSFSSRLFTSLWCWDTLLSSSACSSFSETIRLSKASFCRWKTQLASFSSLTLTLSVSWCNTLRLYSSCMCKSFSRSAFSSLSRLIELSNSCCCLVKSETTLFISLTFLPLSELSSRSSKTELSLDWDFISPARVLMIPYVLSRETCSCSCLW